MLYVVTCHNKYANDDEWFSTNLPEAIFDDHDLAVAYIRSKAKNHEIVREDECFDGWYMLEYVVKHGTFGDDYNELVRYQIPGLCWELNKP